MSFAAQIHARRQRFHAEIARKAAELKIQAKVDRSYSIPNKPLGVPKIRPVQISAVEFYYRQMWFYDLVFQTEDKARPPTIALIQETACRHFRVKLSDMISPRRTKDIVNPRHVAMYLAKQLTTKSYPEIGRRFGGRDHSSTIHAVKRIEKLKKDDPSIARSILVLEAQLS